MAKILFVLTQKNMPTREVALEWLRQAGHQVEVAVVQNQDDICAFSDLLNKKEKDTDIIVLSNLEALSFKPGELKIGGNEYEAPVELARKAVASGKPVIVFDTLTRDVQEPLEATFNRTSVKTIHVVNMYERDSNRPALSQGALPDLLGLVDRFASVREKTHSGNGSAGAPSRR